MTQRYSQLRAMLAITVASLKATFRSPQSIFFSLFFPIVLIWIFGSLGRGGIPSYDVALEKHADTATPIYQALKRNPSLHFVKDGNKDIEDELKKREGSLQLLIFKKTGIHCSLQEHHLKFIYALLRHHKKIIILFLML